MAKGKKMEVLMPRTFLAVMMMVMLLPLAGCATGQMGAAMQTTVQVAQSAPGLARQLDGVYAYLVAQKAVPDHLAAATKALAALDAIAPLVQAGAASLQGDNFNWVQFVMQAALIAAQAIGYVSLLI
jgi:hypothetical protein